MQFKSNSTVEEVKAYIIGNFINDYASVTGTLENRQLECESRSQKNKTKKNINTKVFQVYLRFLCQHVYLFKSVTKHSIDPENKLGTSF